ncbi:hypothetical protein [Marimonas lutisalis]|nr:hypothetical protein [Marimonas lutisalis]
MLTTFSELWESGLLFKHLGLLLCRLAMVALRFQAQNAASTPTS